MQHLVDTFSQIKLLCQCKGLTVVISIKPELPRNSGIMAQVLAYNPRITLKAGVWGFCEFEGSLGSTAKASTKIKQGQTEQKQNKTHARTHQ